MMDAAARGVILAAGRGSRMGKLTEDRPKCLAEAGGRTLLDWQLKSLRQAGVVSIAVVGGYRRELLRRPGLSLFENPKWERSSTLVSLMAASPWLEKFDCVVSYGDIAYHPDIVADLLAHPGGIVIPYDLLWRPLWSQRFARPESDAESFRVRDGRLVEIGGRPASLEDVQGQFMGLLKISPDGWARVRRLAASLSPELRDALDTTATLSRLLADGVAVAAMPVRGRWCEFDSAQDLRLCRRHFSAKKDWSHDWRF